MVDPRNVWRVVNDAARLAREGELVVFGSGALAFWLRDPPTSRDVDLWLTPPERGEPVQALMGELSWYHERHGSYVEVWAPETFVAAKLERLDPHDTDHVDRILRELPLSPDRLDALAQQTPYRAHRLTDRLRVQAFETNLEWLRRRIQQQNG